MASFILREPWDRSWGESAGVPALREDGLLEPSELDFKRFRRGKAGRALRGSNRGRWENSTEAKGHNGLARGPRVMRFFFIKQQSELDREQRTSSKLGKEYVKAVYCHPAYFTSLQSISCETSN